MDVPNVKEIGVNMVRTKEEILEHIKNKIGDSTDEKDLQMLEDISDTLDDFKDKVDNAGDWKAKYEENDKAWKQKYRDRFFNKEANEDIDKHEKEKEQELENEQPKKLTYDALFSEGDSDKH